MPKADIEQDFPSLVGKNYDLSDEDFNYNCLAYAVGDQKNWWEPPKGGGRYWPPGFDDDLRVGTVESIIRVFGFTVETKLNRTPKTESVAIYSDGSEWTHFAKFAGGHWSCKLGEGHDVSRVNLADLEGTLYGRVVKILSRPRRRKRGGR